jgi:hypothetical protein
LVALYVPGPYGPIVSSTGSTAATTTWNPSTKSTQITLSGGNLVATSSAGTGACAFSVASQSTGKYYMEWTLTTKTGGAGTAGVGLANSSFPVDSGLFLGQNSDGIGCFDDGTIYLNGVSSGGVGATFTSGDVVCMAIDATGDLGWWRKNGGNWNNNGAANPATGANGINIAAITGALFVATELESNLSVCTANFGATAYAQTPPSGFGNW